MSALPEVVSQAWDKRQGPIVLATVDATGKPNIIYATCVRQASRPCGRGAPCGAGVQWGDPVSLSDGLILA